jgi:hypothetical protein
MSGVESTSSSPRVESFEEEEEEFNGSEDEKVPLTITPPVGSPPVSGFKLQRKFSSNSIETALSGAEDDVPRFATEARTDDNEESEEEEDEEEDDDEVGLSLQLQ